MPRLARDIQVGVPYHITQRGNAKRNVFLEPRDYHEYLGHLTKHCDGSGVAVLAYCLMTNHVHIIAVASTSDGFSVAIGRTHHQYALRFNKRLGTSGHVWQGRFDASPMDDAHLFAALRYVERNPVRAGLCVRAVDYEWSSAAYHCGFQNDAFNILDSAWWLDFSAGLNWQSWIESPESEQELKRLRAWAKNGGQLPRTGVPLGRPNSKEP